MQKEEVLKLEYIQINDEFTVATIVYQNDNVLKRSCFIDCELEVESREKPEFIYPILFIKGYKNKLDNKPIIIPNEHLEFVKEKVKKLNEKYGVVKKWCPNIGEKYYTISFDSVNNISQGFWINSITEKLSLKKNLIFKTAEEAKFVANKILENIDNYREEYQNEYNNEKGE